MHHVTYRSAGGSDDPANLLLVCPYHHRQIHAGNFKAIGDGDSLFFDDGEVPWHVWPNVREGMEQEAIDRQKGFQAHIKRAGAELMLGCRELGHLVKKNLLWLHDCANVKEFAAMNGVNEGTMQTWARVGGYLVELSDPEFEVLCELPFWRVRDSLPSLRRLPAPDRLLALRGVVDAHKEGQAERSFKESVRALEEAPTGAWLYDVAVDLQGTAYWQLRGEDVRDAMAQARKQILGYKVFQPLDAGDPHTIDIEAVHAERVKVDD